MTVDLLERAVAAAAATVRGIRPDQYDLPSPCAEWNVRALLNHLVAANHLFTAWAAGEQPDMGVFAADHLGGGEPAKAYEEAARAALDAFAMPGATDRAAPLPSGGTGPRVVDMYLMEQVLHGWDLAAATGQDRDRDPEVTRAAYDSWYGRVPPEVREMGTVFGPEQPCPPDAAVADRLAAYLGRPVGHLC
jgi:uncharacterized protein (TIGR03086 family)